MRNSLEQTKLVKQQVDLWHAQSTLRVPPLCRRGTTSMKDVLSFRHGSDEELEEENTACHENERLEGRHVITAGVGRVVLPAAAPVLPRVVGGEGLFVSAFFGSCFSEKQGSVISQLSGELAV